MGGDQAIHACPGCRRRGWTFVRSRRLTAAVLIEGVPDAATRADCLDCEGSGVAL
jgi:hypothetical protein